MKQNQKNRYNGRYNNRNSRLTITRNTSMESTGPCNKLHGTALQLFEKYQAAAKDALIQNDLILAEICMQYADHYIRLQNMAIANEQAMRSNNTNSQSSRIEADELPPVSLPSEEAQSIEPAIAEEKEDQASEPVIEITENDVALSQMDLSVPVMAIQKKHASKTNVRKPRARQKQSAE